MGKAVSYALAQWESLEVYLKEPQIEIDNNLIENAIDGGQCTLRKPNEAASADLAHLV